MQSCIKAGLPRPSQFVYTYVTHAPPIGVCGVTPY